MTEIAKAGWVFLGAGLGGVLRFLIQGIANQRFPHFPWGTLLINVAGSFAMGAFLGWESSRSEVSVWRFLIATGILGGFTTFSAFTAETLKLWQDGARLPALGYVAGSVVLSLIGCALGLLLTGGKR